MEEAIVTPTKLSAIVVDPIKYPPYLLAAKQPIYNTLVAAQFKA